MDDVISRKAAIDVLDKNYILGRGDLNEVLDHIVDRLEKLPSAQPDSKELSFTHKALDTISRQDAIRIVDGIDTWQAGWRGDAIESMKALPSAQPEIIRCKECKHWFDIDDGRQKHRMCADLYGDWFCADAERRTDD